MKKTILSFLVISLIITPFTAIKAENKKADIEITSAKFIVSNINAGENILMQISLKNNGEKDTNQFKLIAVDGQNWNAKKTINNLKAKTSQNVILELKTDQAKQLAGNHFFNLKADYLNQVNESDEKNNISNIALEIQTQTTKKESPVKIAGFLDKTAGQTPTDKKLAQKLAGRLLLATENNGRVFYINPQDLKVYEITFENLEDIFKKLSIGISDKDLLKIKVSNKSISANQDSDKDGYNDIQEVNHNYDPYTKSINGSGNDKIIVDSNLSQRLTGQILLRVNQGGEIYYVDNSGERWAVTYENAMNLFQELALGINNKNLQKLYK